MSEIAMLEEFNIAMNGLDLAQADSIVFQAMKRNWKNIHWHFLEHV